MLRYILLFLVLSPLSYLYGNGDDSTCKKQQQLSYVHSELFGVNAAISYFDSVNSCSNSPSAIYTKAELLYNGEQYQDALTLFDKYISLNSQNEYKTALAMNYAGICLYLLNNHIKAEKYYLAALDKKLISGTIFYNLGINSEANYEFRKAISFYEKAIVLDDKSAKAYFHIGKCNDKIGYTNKAKNYYAAAYNLSSRVDYDIYFNYGKSLKKTGQYDSALKVYNQALKEHPNSYELHNKLAQIYNFYIKNNEKGLYHSRKSIALAPRNSSAYFELAAALSDAGNKDSAIYYYHLTVQLDPYNYAAYGNMGVIYRLFGKFDKALEYNLKSIEINPNFKDGYRNLGTVYEFMLDFENMLKYEKIAYEIGIDKPEKALGLGYAYLVNGEYNLAIRYLKEAMVGRKDYMDIPNNNIGLAFIYLNKLDSAKRYLDISYSISQQNSYLYHNRALYFYKVRDFDSACIDLKKSIDLEYNWIIDKELEQYALKNCNDVNTKRKVNIYAYKGYHQELSDKNFIELVDSLSEHHYETSLKELKKEVKLDKESKIQTPEKIISFSIFPNPTKEKVTIKSMIKDLNSFTVDLYNSNGKKVTSHSFLGDETTLDISSLSKGLYVAVVLNNNKVLHTEKIVMQ